MCTQHLRQLQAGEVPTVMGQQNNRELEEEIGFLNSENGYKGYRQRVMELTAWRL